jgi:UDP-glucose 4-epimerase
VKLTGKSVLVTGGAGFIGSHLVDRIIQEEPSNLVVVDNFFLGREENLKEAHKALPTLRVHRLDASNLPAMQQVMQSEKIEVVFNLAVIPLPTSLHYPSWTTETNIEIATTFCELARTGCIQTLIHCSSSEAYGSALHASMNEDHPLVPSTPYAASKAAGDQIVLAYCQTFGIDAVIARPFNNFGPRQNPGTYAGVIPIVISRVKRGETIEIFGDGLQTRDYIFVRYTAEAMVRICASQATRGRVINIATGHEITINDLVSRLVRVMGAPDHPVVHVDPRPGDVRRHCGDVRQLKALTGFEPQAISDADLNQTVEWYSRSFHL